MCIYPLWVTCPGSCQVPPPICRWEGMTTTPADAALIDLERILTNLDLPAAVRESILCGAETYGDLRADEALASLPQ
jgi:hypothetical protein